MSRYLLIGAGFSRNWGGWLASEVFEYLIGDPLVSANASLRAMLWKHHAEGGFESALDELDRGSTRQSQADAHDLRKAVTNMFETMNSAFKSGSLEFRATLANDVPVRDFLFRFQSIFTLNQDLLLEHRYRGSRDGLITSGDVSSERDWHLPGMRLVEPSVMFPSAVGVWAPSGDQTVQAGSQPIFKLHGSCNWKVGEGNDMMILGGGKAEAIERFPVLRWYIEVLKECLARPDAKLMVIGYGFRDQHINEILGIAMDAGLKIFIVDVMGVDVVGALNSVPKGAIGHAPTELERRMERALIGASRRPLSLTFSTDDVERRKMERFFTV